MEQALPSPSDGWHACSRRCQLALDLTVRGTGYTHPCLHSPGDCNVVGVFSLFVSRLLLSRKNFSSEFATLHLVFADRRATARTTNLRWAMQHPDKKKGFWSYLPTSRSIIVQESVWILSLSRGNRTRKPISLDMCLDMQWKVVTSRATSYGPLGQRNNPSGALMPGKGIGWG